MKYAILLMLFLIPQYSFGQESVPIGNDTTVSVPEEIPVVISPEPEPPVVNPVDNSPPTNVESEQVNFQDCEYDIVNKNVYAPFYYHITHDPAVGQRFVSRHDDNPFVVPFSRSPDTNEAASNVTWFEFGSSANATATYEFELGLRYLTKSDAPRPITIQLFSENELLMEKKVFQEPSIGCMAFRVHIVPPIHILTNEEILEIAKLQFVGITKQYTDAVDKNTDESKNLRSILIVESLVFIFVVGYLVLNDRIRKKRVDEMGIEYNVRGDMMSTATIKMDMNAKYQELKAVEQNVNFERMMNSVVNTFGHFMQEIESGKNEIVKVVKKICDDLRFELDLQAKFVEEHPEIIQKQVEQKQEPKPVEEKQGDSFVDNLKKIISTPFNALKKDQPEPLSDLDAFKIECDVKTNEELAVLFEDLRQKSINELMTGKGRTVNAEKVDIIVRVMNSRRVDYEKEK